MWLISILTVLILVIVDNVYGQGRMLSPPGRSSLWRVGYNAPINYNDNVLNCGGNKRRWETNKGKCGVCGDPWDVKTRDNEAGGQYATGVIAGDYIAGSTIEVIIDIATDSGGYFEFRLCANNYISKPVTSQCLDNGLLYFKDGKSTKYDKIKVGLNEITLKLPADLECEQCVLQWKYRTADQYGCDYDSKTNHNKCGFGHGEVQTEYYACADIAIHKAQIGNSHNAVHSNTTSSKLNRKKRQAHWDAPHLGDLNRILHYLPGKETDMTRSRANNRVDPTFSSPTFDNRRFDNSRFSNPRFENSRFDNTGPNNQRFDNVRFEPLPEHQFTTPDTAWGWHNEQVTVGQNGFSRIRRQTPTLRQMQERMQQANPHLNGVMSATLMRGGSVRKGFNRRHNGRLPEHTGPLPTLIVPTESSIARGRPQSFGQDINRRVMFTVNSNPQSSRQITIRKVSNPRPTRIIKQFSDHSRMQRNFLDPMSANVGHSEITVHTVTQKVLRGAARATPTRQCEHCPFDQCLDDQLRLDSLFPGLFDSPSNFFECKRYERIFTVGNYDVIQEGLPSCSHPRFKRQLQTMVFDDDDIGCCSTRPQVILPLTVEADNDTFSVVQLNDQKKQFIVQGICRKTNTSSCSVCAVENNFQWVLVYDPRVNTNPPVSFVPVKFPHYCRCYNYHTLKG